MPDSFPALLVAVLALLPGALYTWSFEREAGPWGTGWSDRVLRFVGASAVLHALLAPAAYELYREFVVTGRLARGAALPWWVWLLPVGYVVVPSVLGVVVAANRDTRALRYVVGRTAAPRAYDFLFASGRTGWVRVKLKDGTWLVGPFAARDSGLRSYASGYPNPPQLFLLDTVEVEANGDFVLDADGEPRSRGVGVLVDLDRAEYLEWVER